jgi:hypothetical protein
MSQRTKSAENSLKNLFVTSFSTKVCGAGHWAKRTHFFYRIRSIV